MIDHRYCGWPPVVPCQYGTTVWHTTEDKRELIFYSFSLSLCCGKLNTFLQNTWTDKDQHITNSTDFSHICSEIELGIRNWTEIRKMVKCCTPNFDNHKKKKPRQIRAAIQFLAIHLSFLWILLISTYSYANKMPLATRLLNSQFLQKREKSLPTQAK